MELVDPAAAASTPTWVRKPISMRAVTTPINLLVCGASGSCKSSFIKTCASLLCPPDIDASGSAGQPQPRLQGEGAHASTQQVPEDATAVVLPPILVPEASRELLYTFHDWPGWGCTLDPASYLQALLAFLMRQQEKDYCQLHGCRGMHKSLACGCLTASITACIYFLPPQPSHLDLVLLAGLSRHVDVIPVVGRADSMTGDEAATCCEVVRAMLTKPADWVPGLAAIEAFRFGGMTSPLLLHTRATPASAGLATLLDLLSGDEACWTTPGTGTRPSATSTRLLASSCQRWLTRHARGWRSPGCPGWGLPTEPRSCSSPRTSCAPSWSWPGHNSRAHNSRQKRLPPSCSRRRHCWMSCGPTKSAATMTAFLKS